jgi:hypothetical protein
VKAGPGSTVDAEEEISRVVGVIPRSMVDREPFALRRHTQQRDTHARLTHSAGRRTAVLVAVHSPASSGPSRPG